MGVLKNPKHEAFAQAVASMAKTGKSLEQCYADVGYKPDPKNAARLTKKDAVRTRIDEIQTRAASKIEISLERWLLEVARLATSDVRKVIDWRGHMVEERDQEGGGEVLVVKQIVTNSVRLKNSDEIDDDAAAAISEVRQYADGSLGVKMHSKTAALEMLGKFIATGKSGDAPPAEANTLTAREYAAFMAMPPLERARRMLFALELVARDNDKAAAEAAKPVQQIEGTTV